MEPFSNDLASISVSGVLGRRVTVSLNGALSRGDALGVGRGSFDASGGSAAVRYGFRYGALFAGYTRYDHRLTDIVTVPGGFAPRYDQNSVRAGLTIWLPLFGGF